MSHSHLPPRPEFEHTAPSRYPPPDRYGRPMAPPSDRYRDNREPYPPRSPPRDRGDVYVPRSPPRTMPRSSAPYSRDPPRDTYPIRDALPPRDTYPPRDLPPRDVPPRDPYYDRREDDRYFRDWQRRDGPEYRSRPPPPPRDYGREPPSDWRNRDIDRSRRWEDDRRRSYDWDRRERSPVRDRAYPRSRDDERPLPRERPLEPERRWVPRASRSPPRRMALGASSGPRSSSISRGRSPSPPPRFRESPTRSNFGRPSSPPRSPPPRDSSRYTSPGVLKLGNHSIDVSPRYTPRRDRGRPRSPGSRPHSPTRFRSGSRSPVKRSPAAASQQNVENTRLDETKREDTATSIPTDSRPSDVHHSPTLVKQEKPDIPAPSARAPTSTENRRLPDSKAVPEISLPVPSPSQSHAPSGGYSQPRRRSRSPPTQPRHFVKTPTTPSSPKVPVPTQNLPVKPEWSNKASPLSTSTPAVEAAPPHSAPSANAPAIPRYRPNNMTQEIEAEIARVEAQRGRLSSEYLTMAKETRRAFHELELTTRDLKLAEQRRSIAAAQLEKARAGLLGVEYSA